MKKAIFSTFLLCMLCRGYAQNKDQMDISIFEKITKEMANYKLDTSAVPADKMTRKIAEMRALKGGFNIDEALQFKFEEDQNKGDISEAEAKAMLDFFQKGNGKKWLDNAVTWIYRNHFTYDEMKQMVKFYKTSAGKKLSQDFPIIIFQSLTAAQTIGEAYKKQQSSKGF